MKISSAAKHLPHLAMALQTFLLFILMIAFTHPLFAYFSPLTRAYYALMPRDFLTPHQYVIANYAAHGALGIFVLIGGAVLIYRYDRKVCASTKFKSVLKTAVFLILFIAPVLGFIIAAALV